MGRSCSAYRPLTNHQQRKFGLGRSAERHSNRARRARKFGPSPTPLEAMQNPDWRAQRHRQGRRCEASRTARQNSQSEARPRSPLGEPTPPDEPDCCSKTAIADRAPLRRPPRRAQLRCCSAGYGAVSEKEPRPTVSGRTPELGSHHGGPDASHSGGTHSVFCCQPLPQTPPPGRPARNLAIPSCESPPAGKSYEHRRVARPARGGGDSRTPQECSFSICCPTFEHPPPRELLRPTFSVRAPFPVQPSRRDERPVASPSGETHSVFCCPPLPQTPPPGRPARKTARHAKTGLFSAKLRWQRSKNL